MATQKNKNVLLRLITKVKSIAGQTNANTAAIKTLTPVMPYVLHFDDGTTRVVHWHEVS